MPHWQPDWRPIFFAAERRVSPRLEALLRSDAGQDTIAVANGLSRMLSSSLRSLGSGLLETVGLPSGRQLARLQRSLDALARDVASDGGTTLTRSIENGSDARR